MAIITISRFIRFTGVLLVIAVYGFISFSYSQQTPEEIFKSGKDALEKKNYQEAVNQFSAYLKINADSAFAYFERGNAFYGLENFKSAKDDYLKASQLQ